MQDVKKKAGYLSVANTHYLSIPYEGDAASLVIEMRDDGATQQSNINHVIQVCLNGEQEVNLTMPKFKAEFKTELIPVFKSLGIQGIFGGQNMKKISDAQIGVTQIIH